MHSSVPKRFIELIALVSASTAVFLFIHSQILTARIDEMQEVLTSAASSPSAQKYKLRSPEHEKHEDVKGSSAHAKGYSFTLSNRVYNATALNNTRLAGKETLFFNRVPKVGSQMIINLIQRLADKNAFEFHKDEMRKVETVALTYNEEKGLTRMIDMFKPPSAYARHNCYSNFTRHGYSTPIYMNVVRDPIERVISWYYYIRTPWYIITRKEAFPELPVPQSQWLMKDFDTCVLSGDRECQFIPGEHNDDLRDHRRQALFFCGHDKRCKEFNGEWAIQQAKQNVEKYYSVVGVLEELDISLQVLEQYIPRFFQGAPHLYRDNVAEMREINKNVFKPPVAQKVKDMLRANFTREIEFYEFCKQRLHSQYAALIQNPNKTK